MAGEAFDWSPKQVQQFVEQQLRLPGCVQNVARQRLDGKAFLALDWTAVLGMRISEKAQARKLYQASQQLRDRALKHRFESLGDVYLEVEMWDAIELAAFVHVQMQSPELARHVLASDTGGFDLVDPFRTPGARLTADKGTPSQQLANMERFIADYLLAEQEASGKNPDAAATEGGAAPAQETAGADGARGPSTLQVKLPQPQMDASELIGSGDTPSAAATDSPGTPLGKPPSQRASEGHSPRSEGRLNDPDGGEGLQDEDEEESDDGLGSPPGSARRVKFADTAPAHLQPSIARLAEIAGPDPLAGDSFDATGEAGQGDMAVGAATTTTGVPREALHKVATDTLSSSGLARSKRRVARPGSDMRRKQRGGGNTRRPTAMAKQSQEQTHHRMTKKQLRAAEREEQARQRAQIAEQQRQIAQEQRRQEQERAERIQQRKQELMENRLAARRAQALVEQTKQVEAVKGATSLLDELDDVDAAATARGRAGAAEVLTHMSADFLEHGPGASTAQFEQPALSSNAVDAMFTKAPDEAARKRQWRTYAKKCVGTFERVGFEYSTPTRQILYVLRTRIMEVGRHVLAHVFKILAEESLQTDHPKNDNADSLRRGSKTASERSDEDAYNGNNKRSRGEKTDASGQESKSDEAASNQREDATRKEVGETEAAKNNIVTKILPTLVDQALTCNVSGVSLEEHKNGYTRTGELEKLVERVLLKRGASTKQWGALANMSTIAPGSSSSSSSSSSSDNDDAEGDPAPIDWSRLLTTREMVACAFALAVGYSYRSHGRMAYVPALHALNRKHMSDLFYTVLKTDLSWEQFDAVFRVLDTSGVGGISLSESIRMWAKGHAHAHRAQIRVGDTSGSTRGNTLSSSSSSSAQVSAKAVPPSATPAASTLNAVHFMEWPWRQKLLCLTIVTDAGLRQDVQLTAQLFRVRNRKNKRQFAVTGDEAWLFVDEEDGGEGGDGEDNGAAENPQHADHGLLGGGADDDSDEYDDDEEYQMDYGVGGGDDPLGNNRLRTVAPNAEIPALELNEMLWTQLPPAMKHAYPDLSALCARVAFLNDPRSVFTLAPEDNPAAEGATSGSDSNRASRTSLGHSASAKSGVTDAGNRSAGEAAPPRPPVSTPSHVLAATCTRRETPANAVAELFSVVLLWRTLARLRLWLTDLTAELLVTEVYQTGPRRMHKYGMTKRLGGGATRSRRRRSRKLAAEDVVSTLFSQLMPPEDILRHGGPSVFHARRRHGDDEDGEDWDENEGVAVGEMEDDDEDDDIGDGMGRGESKTGAAFSSSTKKAHEDAEDWLSCLVDALELWLERVRALLGVDISILWGSELDVADMKLEAAAAAGTGGPSGSSSSSSSSRSGSSSEDEAPKTPAARAEAVRKTQVRWLLRLVTKLDQELTGQAHRRLSAVLEIPHSVACEQMLAHQMYIEAHLWQHSVMCHVPAEKRPFMSRDSVMRKYIKPTAWPLYLFESMVRKDPAKPYPLWSRRGGQRMPRGDPEQWLGVWHPPAALERELNESQRAAEEDEGGSTARLQSGEDTAQLLAAVTASSNMWGQEPLMVSAAPASPTHGRTWKRDADGRSTAPSLRERHRQETAARRAEVLRKHIATLQQTLEIRVDLIKSIELLDQWALATTLLLAERDVAAAKELPPPRAPALPPLAPSRAPKQVITAMLSSFARGGTMGARASGAPRALPPRSASLTRDMQESLTVENARKAENHLRHLTATGFHDRIEEEAVSGSVHEVEQFRDRMHAYLEHCLELGEEAFLLEMGRVMDDPNIHLVDVLVETYARKQEARKQHRKAVRRAQRRAERPSTGGREGSLSLSADDVSHSSSGSDDDSDSESDDGRAPPLENAALIESAIIMRSDVLRANESMFALLADMRERYTQGS